MAGTRAFFGRGAGSAVTGRASLRRFAGSCLPLGLLVTMIGRPVIAFADFGVGCARSQVYSNACWRIRLLGPQREHRPTASWMPTTSKGSPRGENSGFSIPAARRRHGRAVTWSHRGLIAHFPSGLVTKAARTLRKLFFLGAVRRSGASLARMELLARRPFVAPGACCARGWVPLTPPHEHASGTHHNAQEHITAQIVPVADLASCQGSSRGAATALPSSSP
ncbi:exported hypothetical protein [Burkholderiales bacterium]|nr:exported hypothetical protein [Burkholderiales bacterium]